MLKFACQKDCWHRTACPAALEHFGSAALSWSLSAPAPPCSAAWNPAPPWYTMGSRGTACFTVLLTTGPGGLLLWRLEHLSPSFSTDLGICKAVSHSSLSPSCCSTAVVLFFLSSACSPRGTDNITSWPSSGQQQGPSLTWGSFRILLAEPTPMPPCYQNLATGTHCTALVATKICTEQFLIPGSSATRLREEAV